MFSKEEIDDFIVSMVSTMTAILVLGIIGALSWWAIATESLKNILMLAGLMGIGVIILVAGLLAWLRMGDDRE
mgnify:FL=1